MLQRLNKLLVGHNRRIFGQLDYVARLVTLEFRRSNHKHICLHPTAEEAPIVFACAHGQRQVRNLRRARVDFHAA